MIALLAADAAADLHLGAAVFGDEDLVAHLDGELDGFAILILAAGAEGDEPGVAGEHHETQAAEVGDVLTVEFEDILLHKDLNGRPRFTTAVRR